MTIVESVSSDKHNCEFNEDVVRAALKDFHASSGEARDAVVDRLAALTRQSPISDGQRACLGDVHIALAYYFARNVAQASDAVLVYGKAALGHLSDNRRASPIALANAQLAIALALWHQGDIRGTEPHYRAALAAAERSGRDGAIIECLSKLALCLQKIGKGSEALEVYKIALGRIKGSKNHGLKREILRRLSTLASDLGHHGLALERLRDARPPSRASISEKLQWRHALALMLEQQLRFQEAERHYDRCIDLYEQNRQATQAQIGCLPNAGLLKLALGKTASARYLLERCMAYADDDQPPEFWLGFFRLQAEMAADEDRLDNALDILREGIAALDAATHRSGYAYALVLGGLELLLSRQRIAGALDWINEHTDFGSAGPDSAIEPEQALLGTVWAWLNTDPAALPMRISIARQTLLMAGQIEDQTLEALALAVMANIAAERGRLDDGVTLAKLSAQLTVATVLPLGAKVLSRSAILTLRQHAAKRLCEMLIEAGRLLECREMKRILREVEIFDYGFRQHRSPAHIAFTQAELLWTERYRDCTSRLRAGGANAIDWTGGADRSPGLRRALAALAELISEILDAPPARPRPASSEPPAEVLQRVPDDTAVLRYNLLDGRLIVGIEHSGRRIVTEIALGGADLSRLILAHSEQILTGRDCGELSRELYDRLLRPVRSGLARASRIEIVAQEVLEHLSFAALHDGRTYLAAEKCLIYRSGIGGTPGKDRVNPSAIFAFGSDRAIGDMAALPYVRDEIAAIKAIFPRLRSRLNGAFSRRSLAEALRSGPDIVHIATHFRLLPGAGDKSGFTFGAGDPLSLDELARPEFAWAAVKAVFLSACETGLGVDEHTVPALLHHLGVDYVIASVAPVLDMTTASLVGAFYAALKGTHDPVESLKVAQRALMGSSDDRLAHPRSWSPFKIFIPGA